MERRTFLSLALAPLPSPAVPIIDAHVHFYDPTRPQGVPWPRPEERVLYRTVLPPELRELAGPLGVVGCVKVEASPWLEDNQWVLDLAAREPFIVAVVGHLDPQRPDFAAHLARFSKDPLYRGIRIGNLGATDPDSLKPVAAEGLQIDVIGGPAILTSLLRLTDRVPGLRVVIDHLPFDPPYPELKELRSRPRVYAKVSGVLRRDGSVVRYRASLDELWDIFGPDRVLYGSNWPVSNLIAPYREVLAVVRDYFNAKGRDAAEKYFWKNSQTVYRWVARTRTQPTLN